MLFSDRIWQARWIGTGIQHLPWNCPSRPLPFFRRTFSLKRGFKKAVAYISAPGWMECHVNGRKVSDDVLQPAPSQFESVVHYVKYDITAFLKAGKNTIGMLLGNGWYCCGTVNDWHFEHAPWKDYPKFLFELVVDGSVALVSDGSWQCLAQEGPFRFSELRNGETYDARLEIDGWSENGFDASGWAAASVVSGPGGFITEQRIPPCRVHSTFKAKMILDMHEGGKVYDVGQNIAGWARIRLRGAAGTEIKITYGEKVDDHASGYLDRSNDLMRCTKSGEFQTDRYILRGGDVEEWSPRFTYHGFQYIRVEVKGAAEVLDVTACAVSTNFDRIASFDSSDAMLNRIAANNIWSFLNNFVGTPTDCPQREKNSWVGDAMFSAETGLTLFDIKESYRDWLQNARAVQWPNGIMSGLAINPGWGFTWGTGSGDYVFLYIPWEVYVYTGDKTLLEENWDAIWRVMEHLDSICVDGILHHGLGDWFHVDSMRRLDENLCATMEYYGACRLMAKVCSLLKKDDVYTKRAEVVRAAILREYYHGNGHIGKDEMTALGLALFFNVCPEEDRAACAKLLNDIIVANDYRPDYGVAGCRVVLRTLCENGYEETAYRQLMQPAFPGYVDMIYRGATTLWEGWNDKYSMDHIMMGDIVSWLFTYLGGLRRNDDAPGFTSLTIKPFCPQGLEAVKVSRRFDIGDVTVAWRKVKEDYEMTVTRPANLPCTVVLPDGRSFKQHKTAATYKWKQK